MSAGFNIRLPDLASDRTTPVMKPTISATGEWIEVPATWIDGDHKLARPRLVAGIQEAIEKDTRNED